MEFLFFYVSEAPVTEGAGLFSPVTIKTLQPFCSQTTCPSQKFDKNISWMTLNPIALRKAKIVCNFGLSECNKVKLSDFTNH